MSAVNTSLIVLNAALFAVLGLRALRMRLSTVSPYLRSLAWLAAGASAAFVLGAAQRLAIQAMAAGWIDDIGISDLASEWQLLQSVVTLGIGVAAFQVFSRIWGPIRMGEQLVSTFGPRLPDLDVSKCGLTARELEVVEVIAGGLMSDREIADRLYISPATAATHVKRILRKSGLSSRRDLLLLCNRHRFSAR